MIAARAGGKSSRIMAAWVFWFLIFAAIGMDVLRHPLKHTTMPTYRLASTQWWAGQDVYSHDSHAGFLYFPQAAVLFTPFNLLPFYAGEILWRAATFGLFAYALVRLNSFFLTRTRAPVGKSFLILSLLAVPSAFASLRNAQFDLPMAALIVLTAAEIAAERWTAATVWLCVALALKPLAVVPLLIFGALYWKLIPRVAAGILIVVLIPFLHWSPAYVAHEYARCVQTLFWAAKGDEPKFSDGAALLSRFGWEPSDSLKNSVRVIFALVYWGLGAMARRRLNRIEAAWTIGALSADYLMLFNPRTETCSYVFLGPFVASLAILYLQHGRNWLGYALGFAALGLACDAIPKLGAVSVHDLTDRWFKPLVALCFLPLLIQFIFGWRRGPNSEGLNQ
jgi:alpha-1,2-mannosyltransferase